MKLQTDLVLASQSPRRRRLLEKLGVTFSVVPSSVDEHIPADADPAKLVQSLSLQKARDVASSHPSALTLAGDTVVVYNHQILGQPVDADEAADMLGRLSGRSHTVCSGIALVHPDSEREYTTFEATEVTMSSLRPEEIGAYVESGLPMDKAGAYGIQDAYGALFVTGIQGDYYNVMGLPLHRLYVSLRNHFGDLVDV